MGRCGFPSMKVQYLVDHRVVEATLQQLYYHIGPPLVEVVVVHWVGSVGNDTSPIYAFRTLGMGPFHRQVHFVSLLKLGAKYTFFLSYWGWSPPPTSNLHNFVVWSLFLLNDQSIDIYFWCKCQRTPHLSILRKCWENYGCYNLESLGCHSRSLLFHHNAPYSVGRCPHLIPSIKKLLNFMKFWHHKLYNVGGLTLVTCSIHGWETFSTPRALTHIRIIWPLSPMAPQVPHVTVMSPLCPWCCIHSSWGGEQQCYPLELDNP
jgi:hypothetical protein